MNSKAKGAQFEREVCVALSKWVTHGKRNDCFWRSAMSGGRATIAHARGESNRQAGDICSVSPEGHALTDRWYVECKFVRDVNLQHFIITGNGDLKKYIDVAIKQADVFRHMLLLVKQNNRPVLAFTSLDGKRQWPFSTIKDIAITRGIAVYLFSEILATTWKTK